MPHKWTESEDELLRQLVQTYGKQWTVIASHIPSRTAAQVTSRWEKCINPTLTKGAFSPDEDNLIIDFVSVHGTHSWADIAKILPHRSPKQCRERWLNHLDPSIVKMPWTLQEDTLIFELFTQFGPKWSAIAPMVEGRSENAIKNRWNASISHRIRQDASGKSSLTPAKPRAYTKRKPVPEKRPPPIAIPPVVTTAGLQGFIGTTPTILSFTPLPFSVGSPRFEEGMYDPNDAFEGMCNSPVRFGMQSPAMPSCDFF
jgi:hypothetical protein